MEVLELIFLIFGIIINKYMWKKISLICLLLSASFIFWFMNFFNPSSGGLVGILSIFICTYVSSVIIILWLLYAVKSLFNHIRLKNDSIKIDIKRLYYYASILGFSPVLMLAVRSIGDANIYGYALIVLFDLLGCLYISKMI